uniref:Putative ATP/GTP binding protein n=1 Tax=mine drainage metagenome TaxID=410659 RepID=E6Q361_9ZZZZ
MQLFAGTTETFLDVEASDRIAEQLTVSYLDLYGSRPSPSEQNSWKHSLHAIASQIRHMKLLKNGIVLEMQLPLTSRRLDCMLTGINSSGTPSAAIIELKQWSMAEPAEEEACVEVDYGRHRRIHLHPSAQAASYAEYLRENRSVFYENEPVELSACSWLHNFQYDPTSTLLDKTKFRDVLETSPLFCANTTDRLAEYIDDTVGQGPGIDVLDRILTSRFAPSKRLMEHTAAMISGNPVYTLLDEQRVAYEKILGAVRRAMRTKDRSVVLIEGGPGTGKSVIALHVMAELLRRHVSVSHATGSKAFTENLRKSLGARAGSNFRYFNSFMSDRPAELDVIICDEAHRIRESSNNRFTSSGKRSTREQVDEIIDSAKVSVFFIDDRQVVRPGEVGSSRLIRDHAVANGARILEERLEAQFRCAGSESYIDWVNTLLSEAVAPTGAFNSKSERFDLRLFESPEALEATLRAHLISGASARMTAGFCWPWSAPRDGQLVDDVKIDGYRRPWNAKPEAGRLPSGVPKASYWATDPNGFAQIGCIYTAQGFEFDYVGVIWGNDLIFRADDGGWQGVKAASCDPAVKRAPEATFMPLIKNTYRVLLTRGMKGCYLFIQDDETRDYIEGLISES